MSSLTALLESVVVRAAPALHVAPLDGWLLRASGGPSQRINTVCTLACEGQLATDTRIMQTESWYRSHGVRPGFQIGPGTLPQDLDALLQARGYGVERRASTQVADVRDVLARTQRANGPSAVTSRDRSDAWLSLASHGQDSASYDSFVSSLDLMGAAVRYAAVQAAGQTVAACFGVVEADLVGVYGMIALPEARRMGAATALLGALAAGAQAEGCTRLYLQVEVENPPALRLYERAGFREVYRYHYRVLDTPSAALAEPTGQLSARSLPLAMSPRRPSLRVAL